MDHFHIHQMNVHHAGHEAFHQDNQTYHPFPDHSRLDADYIQICKPYIFFYYDDIKQDYPAIS